MNEFRHPRSPKTTALGVLNQHERQAWTRRVRIAKRQQKRKD